MRARGVQHDERLTAQADLAEALQPLPDGHQVGRVLAHDEDHVAGQAQGGGGHLVELGRQVQDDVREGLCQHAQDVLELGVVEHLLDRLERRRHERTAPGRVEGERAADEALVSAGLQVEQALRPLIIAQALEPVDCFEKKHGVPGSLSSAEAHLWGEALKMSFAPRGQMGDPMQSNSMAELSARLLDPARLDRLTKLFDNDRALVVKKSKSEDLQPTAPAATDEKKETTHFSIADKYGNAVSFTVTLNGSYGSGMVSEKFGIAMNDEMDDFATQPGVPNQYGLIQGEANAVEPGKRPLSSMSPTIIEKDGRFVAAVGAPGGPRIPSAVFQVIVRTIAQGLDAEEAVHLPRVHHQFLPDTLVYDARKVSPDVLSKLKSFGHETSGSWIAKTYLVKMNSDGLLEAAADPRGEAASGGK